MIDPDRGRCNSWFIMCIRERELLTQSNKEAQLTQR